jgi:hypothetical protein
MVGSGWFGLVGLVGLLTRAKMPDLPKHTSGNYSIFHRRVSATRRADLEQNTAARRMFLFFFLKLSRPLSSAVL